MALGQFFLGTPERVEQIQRFTPEQQSALSYLMQQGRQGMGDIYKGFDPIEQRARSQFAQQTIPSIAERFTAMGGGALSSPAFASQLGQAGSGLEEALASMRSQYGLQNRSELMQMLGMGLMPQYEHYGMAAQPGLLQQTLPTLGRLGMYGLGSLLNPVGTMTSGLSDMFKTMAMR